MYRQFFFFNVLFLALIVGTVFAQPNLKNLSFIRCNYCIGLKSKNPGVTTASLINVMRMHHQYPYDDYTAIYSQLDTLSRQGATEQICFMAGLIKDSFDQKYNLDWIINYSFEEIYLYFKLLSDSDLRKITYDY